MSSLRMAATRNRLRRIGMLVLTVITLIVLHTLSVTADEEVIKASSIVIPETTGTITGLCIIVEFANQAACAGVNDVRKFLNSDTETVEGNYSSVKNYFLENSYGALTYTNKVRIVQVPYNAEHYRYYDENDPENSELIPWREADQMLIGHIKDALQNSDLSRPSVTLNERGGVLATTILFAGDAYTDKHGLCPHAGTLPEGLRVDLSDGPIWLRDYLLTPMVRNGEELPLGVFCHETGHMICGFPDLNNDETVGRGGVGRFCLMGGGANVDSNRSPAGINAYLKYKAGWATVQDLPQAGAVAVDPDANTFFVYGNEHREADEPAEYFLFEYRDKTGCDRSLADRGLAIWHIDELGRNDGNAFCIKTEDIDLAGAWDIEVPGFSYLIHLEQSDGDFLLESGNQVPKTLDCLYKVDDVFNATSDPASNWRDGTPSGLSINVMGMKGNKFKFRVTPGSP